MEVFHAHAHVQTTTSRIFPQHVPPKLYSNCKQITIEPCTFRQRHAWSAKKFSTDYLTNLKSDRKMSPRQEPSILSSDKEMTTDTVRVDPKIVDLLLSHTNRPFTSLEFFPPKTPAGVTNLKARLQRFKDNVQPLFSDFTWGAGGSTSDTTLDIALAAHKMGHVSNMHLTCTNASLESILEGLKTAYDGGIRNIVALRGDPPKGQEEWTASDGGLTCALDLVKLIREHYNDEFCISVSGYPEGHPNAIVKLEDGFDIENGLTPTEKLRLSKNQKGEWG